ncbi:hypothetical protein P7K49_005971 [Saguinus oedipus]|uniref:Uncharacterized protein n=1 Tax=Saguinus oedipus TaxID=9490 RepID=A0ABQ9W1L6_SAGOE|nr:hypothetical protein P7K49_005971 [Saguinus oedipus]
MAQESKVDRLLLHMGMDVAKHCAVSTFQCGVREHCQVLLPRGLPWGRAMVGARYHLPEPEAASWSPRVPLRAWDQQILSVHNCEHLGRVKKTSIHPPQGPQLRLLARWPVMLGGRALSSDHFERALDTPTGSSGWTFLQTLERRRSRRPLTSSPAIPPGVSGHFELRPELSAGPWEGVMGDAAPPRLSGVSPRKSCGQGSTPETPTFPVAETSVAEAWMLPPNARSLQRVALAPAPELAAALEVPSYPQA